MASLLSAAVILRHVTTKITSAGAAWARGAFQIFVIPRHEKRAPRNAQRLQLTKPLTFAQLSPPKDSQPVFQFTHFQRLERRHRHYPAPAPRAMLFSRRMASAIARSKSAITSLTVRTVAGVEVAVAAKAGSSPFTRVAVSPAAAPPCPARRRAGMQPAAQPTPGHGCSRVLTAVYGIGCAPFSRLGRGDAHRTRRPLHVSHHHHPLSQLLLHGPQVHASVCTNAVELYRIGCHTRHTLRKNAPSRCEKPLQPVTT